jgi:hypothetical protein
MAMTDTEIEIELDPDVAAYLEREVDDVDAYINALLTAYRAKHGETQ